MLSFVLCEWALLDTVIKLIFDWCRPPTRHAGAGGNTQNARKASNTNDTKVASNASVARSLLLERHAVHVGLAQLEAGALVEAVRGLA